MHPRTHSSTASNPMQSQSQQISRDLNNSVDTENTNFTNFSHSTISTKKTMSSTTTGTSSISIPTSTSSIGIDVKELTYTVELGSRFNKFKKQLIYPLDFSIDGGEMVALMGPSGAGKSTLLDLIAGRKRNGWWSGEILFNRRPADDDIMRQTSYVLQDDLHMATLTVRETIMYACWVRMPEGTSLEDREARVNLLIDMLKLQPCEHSLVGDKENFRGISGGQMKRLSIAVEMVTLPKLIFLDEPTSGLDSSIALEVMSAVSNACKSGGRTAVSTIHQPSPETFAVFDKVVLLCLGRLVYCGPADEIVQYFTRPELNYLVAPEEVELLNHAEFALDICAGTRYPKNKDSPLQAADFDVAFRSSNFYVSPKSALPLSATSLSSDANKKSLYGKYNTSVFTHMKMLTHRALRAKFRDINDVRVNTMKYVAAGLLFGIVFFGAGDLDSPLLEGGAPTAATNTCVSFLFLIITFNVMNNLHAIPAFVKDTILFTRERDASAYGPFPFFVMAILINLPIVTVGHTVTTTLSFFLGYLPNSFSYYIYFWFVTYLENIASLYLALLLASITQSSVSSLALFPLVFVIGNRLTGYGLSVEDIPVFWRWLSDINYVRRAFQLVMMQKFDEYGDEGTYVLENVYGYKTGSEEENISILVLVLTIPFLLVFTYYGLIEPRSTLIHVKKAPLDDDPVRVLSQRQTSVGLDLKRMTTNLADTLLDGMRLTYTADANMMGDLEDSLYDPRDTLAGKTQLTVDWYRQSTGAAMRVDREISLTFQNVCYSVPPSDNDNSLPIVKLIKKIKKSLTQEEPTLSTADLEKNNILPDGSKMILRGITGRAQPSEMVALMGASGAGKSTLLDVIAGRKNSGYVSGKLSVNGMPIWTSEERDKNMIDLENSGELANQSELKQHHHEYKMKASICGAAEGYEFVRCAYVMQDDVHIGVLTVEETFTYAAKLRLDSSAFSDDALQQRVNKITDMMGLKEQKDTVIGEHGLRGVSGGQRKRVSIGVEIIHLPELIFLDEPTTGLDSSKSLEVMNAVRNLANQHRTVVATIHQPSIDTFALFDKVLVLSYGRVIYFGPTKDVVTYFTKSPFAFPCLTNNPADYVVAVAGLFIEPGIPQNKKITGEDLCEYYESSSLGKGFLNNISSTIQTDRMHHFSSLQGGPMTPSQLDAYDQNSAAINNILPSFASYNGDMRETVQLEQKLVKHDKYANSSINQISILMNRGILVISKFPRQQVAGIIISLIAGLFFASLYYNMGDDSDFDPSQAPSETNESNPSVYTNRTALLFFGCLFTFMGAQRGVPKIFQDRLLYYRERGANAYGPIPCWLTNFVLKLPFTFIEILVFGTPLYWIVGFNSAEPDKYFIYFFIMFIFSINAQGLIALVAHSNPTTGATMSIVPLILCINMLFAGFLIFIPDMYAWQKFFADISVMRYSFQALMINEFTDNERKLPLQESYLESVGFDTLTLNECVGISVCMTIIISLTSVLVFKYVDHEQR